MRCQFSCWSKKASCILALSTEQALVLTFYVPKDGKPGQLG